MIPFPERNKPANWTVIFHINGENDLLEDMKDIYDKIASVGSSYGQVNLLALFDGLAINGKGRKGLYNKEAVPSIYYVSRFENYEKAEPIVTYPALEDLTNIDNLSYILQEIKNSFPSDHYAYVYLGHGGAGRTDVSDATYLTRLSRQREGEGDDEFEERLEAQKPAPQEIWQYQGFSRLRADPSVIIAFYFKTGYRELTYYGLSKAFAKAGFKGASALDFILLDCCWGQLVENSLSFEDVVNYFVASADEMPGAGIGYDDFCNFLLKHPGIAPDQLANSIVAVNFLTNYDDYLSAPGFEKMGVSLTCTSMRHFPLLKQKLNALSEYLKTNIKNLIVPIFQSRQCCTDYTYEDAGVDTYHMYNIDLLWFLENLRYYNNQMDTVLDLLLADIIIYIECYFKKSYLCSNYPGPVLGDGKPYIGGRGLTITFPETIEQLQHPKSLYGNPDADFENWVWKDFLLAYLSSTSSVLTTIDLLKNIDAGNKYLDNRNSHFRDLPGDIPDIKIKNFVERFTKPLLPKTKWGRIGK